MTARESHLRVLVNQNITITRQMTHKSFESHQAGIGENMATNHTDVSIHSWLIHSDLINDNCKHIISQI